MTSRSFRLETRSRARDEIKRIMQTVEKVRKWEKIWIETGLSNHLKVYKWVPVREEAKEESKEESVQQEEEMASEAKTQSTGEAMDTALPEIQLRKEFPTPPLETPQLSTDQLPPDLLLDTETTPSLEPSTVASSEQAGGGKVVVGQDEQKKVDWEMRKERHISARSLAEEDSSRPRSPH